MSRKEELVIRIVELEGDYYQFGLEQAKEIKQFPNLVSLDQLSKLTMNSNVKNAKEILEKTSPYLLKELEGMAAGLGIPLEIAIKLYSGYDLTFPEMGCTTLIKDGYYVRNYDFSPDLYDARLVFANPIDGYSSVGFSQQVIGRLDGMNEKGLVVGLHFVNEDHRKEGFISTTIVRMLLEQCANIEEAIHFITHIPHGYCYNYSITDKSGKSVRVEASPDHQTINYANHLICTNHFESDMLKDKNKKVIPEESVLRKQYLQSLLTESLSPMLSYQHFRDGNAPLLKKQYKRYFGTLHTVVYAPENLSIMIGVGENSKPTMLSLKEYMDGKLILPNYLRGVISQ